MEHLDLKTILAQMQALEIPGFSQLLSDLKDPLVHRNYKTKMKSIQHNIDLLKNRLETMQSVFTVQPGEVSTYMANPQNFSKQEQRAIANVEQQLGDYWKKLASDLNDTTFIDSTNRPPNPKEGVKAKRNPQKGRKGWIAS